MIACPNGHPNAATELFCQQCDAVMPPISRAPRAPNIRWSVTGATEKVHDIARDEDVVTNDPATTVEPRPSTAVAAVQPAVVPLVVSGTEEGTRPVPRPVLMRMKRRPWWRRRRHLLRHPSEQH